MSFLYCECRRKKDELCSNYAQYISIDGIYLCTSCASYFSDAGIECVPISDPPDNKPFVRQQRKKKKVKDPKFKLKDMMIQTLSMEPKATPHTHYFGMPPHLYDRLDDSIKDVCSLYSIPIVVSKDFPVMMLCRHNLRGRKKRK